ncbi:MAG TPA: tetratricopeptide repeat protein [Bryobacteraceae bacterium]|nr:tetratricopeptide repeat protein [Bryobacteraceae bacterium]
MRKPYVRCIWVTLLSSVAALADQPAQKQESLGLILNPGGAKLLREGQETPLDARAGDLLYAGDGLRTTAGPAKFMFCPSKTLQTLTAAGEVRLDKATLKVKTGKLSDEPLPRSCILPTTLRVAVASQQHVGATLTRFEFKLTDRNKLDAAVVAELTPLDAAVAANDPTALVSAAAIFEKYNLLNDAGFIYGKLRAVFGDDTAWINDKLYVLAQTIQSQQAAAAATGPQGGQTFALLLGVSKFKKPELNLLFANADATSMADLLQTPRGGGVPKENILLLTDEHATTGALRLGFNDFLKRRAGKNDTVIILIAGHGTVEAPGSKSAFILTHDADPQDLKSTALAVNELQELFTQQLEKVARVVMFVDVCKAGAVSQMSTANMASTVEALGGAPGKLFGFLASKPNQVSVESDQYGGGHGVFSYFLLKGLLGAADENSDGVVDAGELVSYVTAQVTKATSRKQSPREFGTYDAEMRLSDTKKPAEMKLTHFPMLWDARSGQPMYLASTAEGPPPLPPQATETLERYRAAIAAGQILPDQRGGAFDLLRDFKNQLGTDPAGQYITAENELRVALEDKAQEILLRYLTGDEIPQSQSDFAQGARYMDAARTLNEGSRFLEARQDFFRGRALLFDKKPESYTNAANLLEQAVRIDPNTAYGFNALGIAYLEQAQFDKALPAFRDAAKRAQHWSYPLHNAALASVETGDYKSAIKYYQQAIKLTPQYSYLHYNLGLVYQRLNRNKDAENAYREAMKRASSSAEPSNALGTLKAAQGKRSEAEQFYKDALAKNPKLYSARHNLALLLASDKNRQQEAIDLWRENLRQSPGFTASQLSLAETLAARGDNAGAIEQYRAVVQEKPKYVAAHLALAQLLIKTADTEGALAELRAASAVESQNFEIFELTGDLEAGRKNTAEAKIAYEKAAQLAPDRNAKKRVASKLKALP